MGAGNIKLLGELYMNSMGDGSLVVHCLRRLANDLNEDNLELLIILIKTVGRKIEKDYKIKGKFKDLGEHRLIIQREAETNLVFATEPFFKRLDQIVRDGHSSERVRFFVQDILELRANGWQDQREQ